MTGAGFFEDLHARRHALVMGVLNITPDSFSDGGTHLDPKTAASAARKMMEQGASIVDIGGESTRPGATPVSREEEWNRVGPVLEQLQGLPISIDTRHASTAEKALDAGAILINDISGGGDPAMLPMVRERGAAICLMHMRGEPGTMQNTPHYDDVVGEVERFLLERAGAAGPGPVFLDPGIGFGKTLEHNLALLAALPRFASHGFPLLLGVSRKRVLGDLTGRPTEERGNATIAAVTRCAEAGAAIVRVHDVPSAFDAVRIAAAW
jgi:dihydropteroate synthase